MCKHYKIITFIVFVFLIIIEITCIFLNMIVLINSLQLKPSVEINSIKEYLKIKEILNIFANSFYIVMILIFGIYSLYFKIKSNLLIYMIL